LVKPSLYAQPSSVRLSFFPEEVYEGTLSITNTSNNAPVRNLFLDATGLDPVDNEIKLEFENGMSTISLGELGPRDSVQVPIRAVIPDTATAKLNNRNLGNIVASAQYTFSIEGAALESMTTTPIPVLYWKPQDLALPSVAYVNDELDGNLNDLEYVGSTYRLAVKSNRNISFSEYGPISAFTRISEGPDARSIINNNTAIWANDFNQTEPLAGRGDIATFDIDGLKEVLESQLESNRATFLTKAHSLGFFGQWEDRSAEDAYLIPISVTTIRNNEIKSSLGMGWSGTPWAVSVPTIPLEHGEVKLQIDQKVSLEREAFNAQLKLSPNVSTLQSVHMLLSIKDQDGNDASNLIQVLVLQQQGISSLEGSNVSGPAEVVWQIIPNSIAGGNQPDGLHYAVKADISYGFDGGSFSNSTQEEIITVMPMPKLAIDYYLPYVVMAEEPVKIKVRVTNQGYGAARNLTIASAQPGILENLNGIPVDFSLNGSSSTALDASYQAGVLNIHFGDIPAGGTAEGYWLLTSTKDGYFVEFTSSLTHESYRSLQLDPLIEQVNAYFVHAIGGHVTQSGSCPICSGVRVELWQDEQPVAQDTISPESESFYISDLLSGDYVLVIRDVSNDAVLHNRNIAIISGQPTAHIKCH
jgi:hypothetical protein